MTCPDGPLPDGWEVVVAPDVCTVEVSITACLYTSAYDLRAVHYVDSYGDFLNNPLGGQTLGDPILG